jgi:hypothetical protein
MVIEDFGIPGTPINTDIVTNAVDNSVNKAKETADKAGEAAGNVVDKLNPFAAIIEALGGVFEFFKKLIQLITNPAKFLPLLLMYIFGFAIWVWCFLWVKLLGIWPLKEVPFFIFYFVTVILVELVISIVFLALFLVFFVIAIAMWILDLATFGLVRWLTRCENHIDAWYKQANFAYDNVAQRLLFAQLPCASRFKPQGFWCVRQASYDPEYCPQQQIFRIYKGLGLSSPWILDKINEDTSFKLKTPTQKEEAIRKFFHERQGFLNKCSKAMHSHKHIVRCICANYKTIKLKNESDRALLSPLCKQVFCDTEGKESFCSKFPEDDGAVDKANLEDIVRKLTRYMVLVVFGTIFLLVFMYNRGWAQAQGSDTSVFETVAGVLK